jgi:hypothetical protein
MDRRPVSGGGGGIASWDLGHEKERSGGDGVDELTRQMRIDSKVEEETDPRPPDLGKLLHGRPHPRPPDRGEAVA